MGVGAASEPVHRAIHSRHQLRWQHAAVPSDSSISTVQINKHASDVPCAVAISCFSTACLLLPSQIKIAANTILKRSLVPNSHLLSVFLHIGLCSLEDFLALSRCLCLGLQIIKHQKNETRVRLQHVLTFRECCPSSTSVSTSK